MALKFPHPYTATVSRIAHARARIEAPPRAPLVGGPPPELGGDATTWSPEHLLCSALGLCLFATFEAYALREQLDVIDWRDTATGMLDRTSGGLAFTSFSIDVELTVDRGDVARAEAILERAKRHCIVSNALGVPVHVEARIAAHDLRAHG